jgi:Right handed beta helix region
MPLHVNIRDFGALGDAVVATDCSMIAGQRVLTSVSARFKKQHDCGKVIAVYGAGNQQPLSSAIVDVLDPHKVMLNDFAQTTINSPRVVYGHDDTAAIQNALDQLALPDGQGGNLGGVLEIPPGHYMTTGLILSGSETGAAAAGDANGPKAYNNIKLKGFGRGESILENWKVDLPPSSAVVALFADVYTATHRLANITIADLTIRQIVNADNGVNSIYSQFTEHVHLRDCEVVSGSYEGVVMSNNSQHWRISGCHFHDCGVPRLAALALGGSYWIAEENEVRNCGIGIEFGGHDSRAVNNKFYTPTNAGYAGISIQSSGDGAWDNAFIDNLFVGWLSPLVIQNGDGVVCNTLIQGNYFEDCGWMEIGSGLESNLAGPTYPDKIHGITIIKDNVLRRVRSPYLAIELGETGNYQLGLESVVLDGNIAYEDTAAPPGFIAFSGSYGGGDHWVSGKLYNPNDLVVPTKQNLNGFYYRCVSQNSGNAGGAEPNWPLAPDPNGPLPDGGVDWAFGGKRPIVRLWRNSLIGPPGAVSNNLDLRIEGDATQEILQLPITAQNLWGNYQLYWYPDPNGGPQLIQGT